jgi:hypothetical protein
MAMAMREKKLYISSADEDYSIPRHRSFVLVRTLLHGSEYLCVIFSKQPGIDVGKNLLESLFEAVKNTG